ncbi:MAG TPA: hypothetical protein VFD02_01290 [Syntrophomonadaceae bacterium]|nr:hypothetical protein [Syntrophomonadaceae bacterium]
MSTLKMRVRFDFIGKGRQGRLFGQKNPEQYAEEVRQHKVSLIRNVPIQGIHIEDIDMSQEIYMVQDEITGKTIAYAPVAVIFYADSMESAVKFTMKEEFRKVEILAPDEINLSKFELERLLIKISEELLNYKNYLERKIDNWK